MIIAGLMTGTSADALDVVLVEFQHEPGAELEMGLLGFREVAFAEDLERDIRRLLCPEPVLLDLVSSVDARLGQASAEAVSALCAEHLAEGRIPDLVVSHGQTVRHDVSRGHVASTLQIGQPAWIAQGVGSPVLSDVRARDVAAGGQGAPLAGILDHLLLSGAGEPAAALNLGGIANITVVAEETLAFDTGPANALIDLMAERISDGALTYDRDGALAAQGTADPALLQDLLAEPYYALPAPKSTGKELFHAEYLDRHLGAHPEVTALDVMATLTELTAQTVAEACRAHQVTQVIASGGGVRNPTLMAASERRLGGIRLRSSDAALGLPAEAKEACLMALLGWLSWHGLPGTQPGITGASTPTIAGRLTPGKEPLRLPEPLEHLPKGLRLMKED